MRRRAPGWRRRASPASSRSRSNRAESSDAPSRSRNTRRTGSRRQDPPGGPCAAERRRPGAASPRTAEASHPTGRRRARRPSRRAPRPGQARPGVSGASARTGRRPRLRPRAPLTGLPAAPCAPAHSGDPAPPIPALYRPARTLACDMTYAVVHDVPASWEHYEALGAALTHRAERSAPPCRRADRRRLPDHRHLGLARGLGTVSHSPPRRCGSAGADDAPRVERHGDDPRGSHDDPIPPLYRPLRRSARAVLERCHHEEDTDGTEDAHPYGNGPRRRCCSSPRCSRRLPPRRRARRADSAARTSSRTPAPRPAPGSMPSGRTAQFRAGRAEAGQFGAASYTFPNGWFAKTSKGSPRRGKNYFFGGTTTEASLRRRPRSASRRSSCLRRRRVAR